MFITQEQLNHVLDNYFTMTDAHIFNQQYFDHSLQLILDNHHDLYDLMRVYGYSGVTLAFEALRRFADEACKDEYGDIQGITTSMLMRWIWTKDKTNTYSFAIMDNTINYIKNERAEAQKEEENTMKSINTIIDLNTISEDITCSHCGCIVAMPEAGEVEAFEVIDGKVYCESCIDDLFVTCEECGKRILLEDAINIDGEYYCKDCVDREFVECYYCDEYVRRDNATLVDGEWCCDDCRDDHCYYCEDCNEWHDIDNVQWVESVDRWVCDNCLNNYYTSCERCGNYVPSDDAVTVHVNDRGRTEEWCRVCCDDYTWICEECEEVYSCDVDFDENEYGYPVCYECGGTYRDIGDINTWVSPRRRMNYSFKPVPCMCATKEEIQSASSNWKESIVFYGFELEIDRENKSYAEDDWSEKIVDKLTSTYCKQDCSLDKGGSYSGIEIVSHPATLAWYMDRKEEFEDCFDMLKEGGWLSHDAGTCGLHVHISLHPLEAKNPFAVHNMLILYDRFWDKLVKFSRRTRSQLDHWAKKYSTAHGTYSMIKDMAKQERDRYMAVNLQNRHTVEIRMFRGTLNPETFFATLQLVDVITKKCIEIGNDASRVQSITWEELVSSDHEELNAYLKRRGLVEGCEEKPEPQEGDKPCIDDYTGMRIIIRDDSDYEFLHGAAGIIMDQVEDDFAVQIENPTEVQRNRLHDCSGRTNRFSGYWIRRCDFDVVSEGC